VRIVDGEDVASRSSVLDETARRRGQNSLTFGVEYSF
jgi:hypothetical protein